MERNIFLHFAEMIRKNFDVT